MAVFRMPTLNRVILAGRATGDPKLQESASGTPYLRLRIAVDNPYKNQDGEWTVDTLFIDVVSWRDMATRMANTLYKGAPVMVEGSLHSRTWESEDGTRRTTYEIHAHRIQVMERRGTTTNTIQDEVVGPEHADDPPTPTSAHNRAII